MTYHETVEYLYSRLPMFQKIGAKALKPKLENIKLLCEVFGNPQDKLKCIHIGGTNGKGSSSHFLASILQENGFKVGLYTSPHLKDFRERFKINGKEVSQEYIIKFVAENKALLEKINLSFFELTVVLAFQYFSEEKVDFAVIEVGLGGRLDSTNIINPILSLITNIGLDHTDILGDTIEQIAFEKAGIIKPNVPIVISEYNPVTAKIFIDCANSLSSKIFFANQNFKEISIETTQNKLVLEIEEIGEKQVQFFYTNLSGYYQVNNILGVLTSVKVLRNRLGIEINQENISRGISNVLVNTNLKGRWQILLEKPLTICDTGHNEHAFNITTSKLKEIPHQNLHLVLGFVKDKDVKKILDLFPKTATYYFCKFDSARCIPIDFLLEYIEKNSIIASFYEDVNLGLAAAHNNATVNDLIFVGGSTYLVAELKEL